MGDVQVTPLGVDTGTARMDLVFNVAERWGEGGEPAGIGGTVEFRTDVFDRASIEALIARLQAVLVGMAADPMRRVSGLDVLDGVEHARLERFSNRAVLAGPPRVGCRFRWCLARRWAAPRMRWRLVVGAVVELSGAGCGG
ncbi:hypothetical protein MSM1_21340 [Mycobacterium sp. SM1]|nr:hypothetical protein [Mycobacterium sp. SM1]